MFPSPFTYFRARSLGDALALMKKYKEEAKVLAGGQSLIPMMKLRLAAPGFLVDIGDLHELSYIRETAGSLKIGALTKQAEIERSQLVRERLPILSEAASKIADQQVRNLGTLGGALCHADPAGDWLAVMLATSAEFKVRGLRERTVRAKDFFKGPFETALKHAEILTEIRIPVAKGGKVGQAYLKLERRAGDYATVGVATSLALDENGTVDQVGLAVCAAGPVPFNVTRAPELMVGRKPTEGLLREVASAAAEQSDPVPDLRGSVDYKKAMVEVFTERALKLAWERAAGKG